MIYTFHRIFLFQLLLAVNIKQMIELFLIKGNIVYLKILFKVQILTDEFLMTASPLLDINKVKMHEIEVYMQKAKLRLWDLILMNQLSFVEIMAFQNVYFLKVNIQKLMELYSNQSRMIYQNIIIHYDLKLLFRFNL